MSSHDSSAPLASTSSATATALPSSADTPIDTNNTITIKQELIETTTTISTTNITSSDTSYAIKTEDEPMAQMKSEQQAKSVELITTTSTSIEPLVKMESESTYTVKTEEVVVKQEAVTISETPMTQSTLSQPTESVASASSSSSSSSAVSSSFSSSPPQLAQLLTMKKSWEEFIAAASSSSATATPPSITASLQGLYEHRSSMTIPLLSDSGIGKTLKSLKKVLKGPEAKLANDLMTAWKSAVQAVVTSSVAAAAPATPTSTLNSTMATTKPATNAASTVAPATVLPDPSLSTPTLMRAVSAAPAIPADLSTIKPPILTPTPMSDITATSSTTSSTTTPSDSAPRKRKMMSSAASPSVLAKMEYPALPIKSTPLQPVLPSADAFFAKPTQAPLVKPGAIKSLNSTSSSSSSSASKAVTHASSRSAPLRQSTSDEFRAKIRLQICKSLAPQTSGTTTPTAASSTDEFSLEMMDVAAEIEMILFQLSNQDTGAAYRNKSREIAMNLRDSRNPELKARVLNGQITPHELLTLPFTALASAELQKERAAERVAETAERRSDNPIKTFVTDAWRCGKCGQRKCSYYQMQTRSADEPMTTFVRCTVCHNRWRC